MMNPPTWRNTILSLSLAIAGCSATHSHNNMQPVPPLTPGQQAEVNRADSQMKTVLTALHSLGPKPIENLSASEARRQPSASDAVLQVLQEKGTVSPMPLPPVGKVEMKTIPNADGSQIPVRIYSPKGDGPFPVIVYYHGGGWVIATVDTYDSSCRVLCDLAKAVVVSVEYRRGPENRFPAAHEDAYAALQYVATHTSQYKGDANHVAVVGESAGGNLATAVCLMAKERGGKMPIHQVLIYPITNYAFDTESYRENAEAVPLNAAMMKWFFDHYLSSPADGQDKRVSPLQASNAELSGLPPATVITAEIDPLRSEGQAYAERLKSAGVDVEARTYAGVTHEFFGMGLVVDKAKEAEAFATDRLKKSFSK